MVPGPTQPLTGIGWPSTAWHMTRDTCRRTAALFRYTSSVSCARSLQMKYPEEAFASFTTFPDKIPFLQLGGQQEMLNPDYPLDIYHRFPSTEKANDRCFTEPRSQTDNALAINDEIYLSGDFQLNPSWGSHIGECWVPIPNPETVKSSNRFFIHSSRAMFYSSKRMTTAHKPHIEQDGLEICVVTKGRLNLAVAASCDDYYDLMSLTQGQARAEKSGTRKKVAPALLAVLLAVLLSADRRRTTS